MGASVKTSLVPALVVTVSLALAGCSGGAATAQDEPTLSTEQATPTATLDSNVATRFACDRFYSMVDDVVSGT